MATLQKARQVAEELKSMLQPFCNRIEIAGSIRREKEEVKDIELVAIVANRNQLALYLYENFGVGCKKDARYIKFSYSGIKVDLFLPQPHDWGRILAIRTGSADYSHRVLATGWVKRGCKGTDKGLQEINSIGETISNPIEFPTEESFFEFIGVKWIEPRLRN